MSTTTTTTTTTTATTTTTTTTTTITRIISSRLSRSYKFSAIAIAKRAELNNENII